MFEQSTMLQPFSNAKIFHLALGNHVHISCLQVCVRLTSYVTIYALLKYWQDMSEDMLKPYNLGLPNHFQNLYLVTISFWISKCFHFIIIFC